MSDILDKIMAFINENTYILIGICVFLILVLIGYLIDNSIKSKKAEKNLQNKLESENNHNKNITKEVIEEDKKEVVQNAMNDVKKEEKDNFIFEPPLPNDVEGLTMELNLEEINESSDLDNSSDSLIVENSQPLSLDLDSTNSSLGLSLDTDIKENNIENIDPDNYVLENKSVSEYKNDRKLSDILSDVGKNSKVQDTVSNNIFDTSVQEIIVNSDVQKGKVEIESTPSDELDKIMQKLSSMNNIEEDNYTNIF